MLQGSSSKRCDGSQVTGGKKQMVVYGILVTLIGLFSSQGSATAQTRDIDLGIGISDGRLQSFYLAIGDHYGIQPRLVVEVRDRYRCPEEELPVVFFLAARAHVEPAAILSLRIQRMSWLDIAFHYRLTPDIFFVPVGPGRIGPPYGNAYGYYRKYGPTRDWKKFRLSDHEVVDLVNLRFMSEHYRMPPETVIAMRGRESRFLVINDEIRKDRDKGKPDKEDQKGKGRGKKKR
ncbi:MAG: hypothetical protein LAP85_11740 [Acidobacteriia bacterium]|nr:hypothetical protein [Terriglobia bacterium]